ncbi:MAG TPA: hypothetical protein VFT59_05625 [Candidatus Saccharimonadales bacterium]|nr:hypothetical protein [Candidatus Saccharimonadales bacterium]
MKIDMIGDYARRMVLPHVQAFLYQLHQQFTCGLEWTKTSTHPFGSTETISAAPLDDKLWLPFVMPSATGEVALSEYMWQLSSEIPPQQFGKPGKAGRIRLETGVSAAIDIFKGIPQYLSEDGSMPGFLCWAERCELQDGSVCYRLQTNAGLLWLRQPSESGLVALFYDQDPPWRGQPTVIHLAETFCYYPRLLHHMMSGPWSGFEARDESGRVWRIDPSELAFSAHCRLRAVGRYNDRLKTRPITILKPPYEAIWQPNGYHEFGLPLQLDVSRT